MPEKNEEKRGKVRIEVCGLCLATVAGETWSLADPDAEVVFLDMCEDCKRDLGKFPPNIAAFAARLWKSLDLRAVDLFGFEEPNLPLFAVLLQANMMMWQSWLKMQMAAPIAIPQAAVGQILEGIKRPT